MFVSDVIKDYQQGKIKHGNIITIQGKYFDFFYEREYPYYYCSEESYFSRLDLGLECSGFDRPLEDSFGYYVYRINWLLPHNHNGQNTDADSASRIHLVSFGMSSALRIFDQLGTPPEDADTSSIITVTGKVLVPQNQSSSGVLLGIGHFSKMSYAQAVTPDVCEATLIQSYYDDRPEIDLSRFSDQFQEEKIKQVLQKTKMQHNQFHWHFEEDDECAYMPVDYWNWSNNEFIPISFEKMRNLIEEKERGIVAQKAELCERKERRSAEEKSCGAAWKYGAPIPIITPPSS